MIQKLQLVIMVSHFKPFLHPAGYTLSFSQISVTVMYNIGWGVRGGRRVGGGGVGYGSVGRALVSEMLVSQD